MSVVTSVSHVSSNVGRRGEEAQSRRWGVVQAARRLVGGPGGHPPAPDGKRRTKSIYSKDRSTAAEKLRKLQPEVDAGLVTAGPATTVGEWLDYWLNQVHRSSIKPGTREDYSRIINNHIRPASAPGS